MGRTKGQDCARREGAQCHASLGEPWLSPRLLTGAGAHKLGSTGFGAWWLGAVHVQKEQGAVLLAEGLVCVGNTCRGISCELGCRGRS